MRLALRLVLVSLATMVTALPAFAQGPWSVSLGGGAAGFGGASTPGTSLDQTVQFKPTPTIRLHLGLARTFGRAGVALDASYAKAALGAYGEAYSYSFNPAMTLLDVRLLATWQVLQLGEASALRIGLGPMLQSWSGDAIVDTRTNIGGAADITMAVPITHSLALQASGSLAVAASPFAAETLADYPPAEPASIWTRELGIGLRFSF